MFSTDVYLQDQVVIVRQRAAAYAPADYVLSHEEMMAASITYRKRPGPIYGIVTIFGGSPTGPIIEVSGDDVAEEVELVETDETPAAFPMKAKARTTTTKRILQSVANEVLLRETSITEVELSTTPLLDFGIAILSGSTSSEQFGVGPATDTFILPSTASSVDEDYTGTFLSIFSPDGNRFDRMVTAYVGATRTLTLDNLLDGIDVPAGSVWRLDTAKLPTGGSGQRFLSVQIGRASSRERV